MGGTGQWKRVSFVLGKMPVGGKSPCQELSALEIQVLDLKFTTTSVTVFLVLVLERLAV